jgi:hypothetical protein
MTEPFDQFLYDRLDAESDNHAPTSETMPKVHPRHLFPEWYDGWDTCAEVAARISAERQPVSDEDLASIFADAIEASHARNPTIPDGQHIIAGLRAVRAAITSQAPVLPEWQEYPEIEEALNDSSGVVTLRMTLGGWEASYRFYDDPESPTASGVRMVDALLAAIEAAKENTNE